MTHYIAFAGLGKFEAWLGTILGVGPIQASTVIRAFLDNSLPEIVGGLSLMSEERAGLESGGLLLQSPDMNRLLAMVDVFRYGIPFSTMFRFAPWGISCEQPDEAAHAALHSDPPDSVIVASADIPPTDGYIRSTMSLAGRAVPSSLKYLRPKSEFGSPPRISVRTSDCIRDTEANKATAYTDIGGFMQWLKARSGLPKEAREQAPTRLANSLLSLTDKASALTDKALRPDKQVGIGTDGVYLTSQSHDALLRLVVWMQGYLACEGVALSVWALNSGHPRFNKRGKPSGDDFFELCEMLKKRTNGDIVTTESFGQHLLRPELAALIRPCGLGGTQAYKVHWWYLPVRIDLKRR